MNHPELLAGQRVGAHEARGLLRKLFAEGGADAVVEALGPGFREIDPPPNRSHLWRHGFRSGINSYFERIRRADEQWGFTEIEHALQRPVPSIFTSVLLTILNWCFFHAKQPNDSSKNTDRKGQVIGTYTLTYGTGFEIWRQEDQGNSVYVSEIHSLQAGLW